MRLSLALPALVLVIGLPENHRVARLVAPAVVRSVAAAVVAKPPDLSDASWFACSSSDDCKIVAMSANCEWMAVRSDKAYEYRQLLPQSALGSRPYNDNEIGPICKDPRVDPSNPLPMGVCTQGRCTRGDCPARWRRGGYCANALERATHKGLYD